MPFLYVLLFFGKAKDAITWAWRELNPVTRVSISLSVDIGVDDVIVSDAVKRTVATRQEDFLEWSICAKLY